MLDTPVTDFELSVRARTCLKKMNIRTLGDLLRITEAELMSYKNFGETSLFEIKKMLSAKRPALGQGLEDAHRAARRALMEQYKGTGQEQRSWASPSATCNSRFAPARPSNSSASRPWATSPATPRRSSWASRTSARPRSRKSASASVR
jgi:hypothetical protein